MTVDGLPLVGPLPDLAGFFVATGCCVSGLSMSAALGESLAALVAGEAPRVPLGPLAPDRFAETWSDDRLRAACVEAYGRSYSTVAPQAV
jgi:glycine/D-amino acid oxidase-like deaminating enzyme